MSEHFELAELLHSDTAVSRNIENLPTWEDIERLKKLADTLESIREYLGNRPMIVSSGYRCPALNAAVGGVPDSAHLIGFAVDFTCPAFGTPTAICEALKPHLVMLEIDQLIDEQGGGARWVHIGLCEGSPRHQYFAV